MTPKEQFNQLERLLIDAESYADALYSFVSNADKNLSYDAYHIAAELSRLIDQTQFLSKLLTDRGHFE